MRTRTDLKTAIIGHSGHDLAPPAVDRRVETPGEKGGGDGYHVLEIWVPIQDEAETGSFKETLPH